MTKAALIEQILACVPDANAARLKRLRLADLERELARVVPVATVAPPMATMAPAKMQVDGPVAGVSVPAWVWILDIFLTALRCCLIWRG